MASFEIVNYSLRPSKSIQRQIVFDGVRKLQGYMNLEQMVYVGFGSIWFTDFVMAHKLLDINDMVSIESSKIGYKRAVFNSPFATVRVVEGYSADILPILYQDPLVGRRPWMLWLDYDHEFDETVADDVRSVIENAPMNSILIITFSGHERSYGHATERPDRLRKLFQDVVPDNLSRSACKDTHMQETLADLAMNFMQSLAIVSGRPGAFVPAFRAIYRDTTPMVTVGGVLPTKGAASTASEVVAKADWPCRPAKPIFAPHLTIREAAHLQSCLPSTEQLSRAKVQSLGFDLEDEQIEAFQNYYRQYPAFAQILA